MDKRVAKKILVLSPHTDDGEIACGGTIAKFIENGWSLYYAVFSVCKESIPPGFPPNALKKELLKAIKVLGIPKKNLFIYGFKVRYFPQHRQQILEELIKLKKKLKPDLVLTPSSSDIHQDHMTIYQESLRAFKHVTILGYEEPWNNIIFINQALVQLERRHLYKKIKALRNYKTQQKRSYFNKDFVEALAKTRGTQIETQYAEGFEVIRWIIGNEF